MTYVSVHMCLSTIEIIKLLLFQQVLSPPLPLSPLFVIVRSTVPHNGNLALPPIKPFPSFFGMCTHVLLRSTCANGKCLLTSRLNKINCCLTMSGWLLAKIYFEQSNGKLTSVACSQWISCKNSFLGLQTRMGTLSVWFWSCLKWKTERCGMACRRFLWRRKGDRHKGGATGSVTIHPSISIQFHVAWYCV